MPDRPPPDHTKRGNQQTFAQTFHTLGFECWKRDEKGHMYMARGQKNVCLEYVAPGEIYPAEVARLLRSAAGVTRRAFHEAYKNRTHEMVGCRNDHPVNPRVAS